MKFIKLLALLMLVTGFILSGCRTKNKCIEKVNPNCVCTMHYDPVCGCNNKTYGNLCMAECSGITDYVKGECPAR